MSTWRVAWQDYRGWRTADIDEPRPPVQFRDFADRAEAEHERNLQQLAGMTTCIEELHDIRRGTMRRPRRKIVQWGLPV